MYTKLGSVKQTFQQNGVIIRRQEKGEKYFRYGYCKKISLRKDYNQQRALTNNT